MTAPQLARSGLIEVLRRTLRLGVVRSLEMEPLDVMATIEEAQFVLHLDAPAP